MRYNIVLQRALLREDCLGYILDTFEAEGSLEFIILVLWVLGEEGLRSVSNHTSFTFLSRHVNLCVAVSIAEGLM